MITKNKIHPTTIGGLDATKKLGEMLGELRYDLLVEVLQGLHNELIRQRDSDGGKGRARLASILDEAAGQLEGTMDSLDKAVSICQHYIDEEKKSAE